MTAEYTTVVNAALGRHLRVRGGFHPDDMPGIGTLILLGPDEPAFWPGFTTSPEMADGQPDPMDRWSARVIGDLADDLGATAFFPFGGPPWHSFLRWAQDTGRAFTSPIKLLVHDRAGLFISYRGALGFAARLDLPAPPADAPCTGCAAPCATACPVDAFATGRYDVAACKAYLATDPGQDCMARGCAARRACPLSQQFGRLPEQSAFHMRAFL
ncbi:ferredoxin [Thalassovita sp.]|uniref:ferredoxin n=1 Tax=Thalassovita sp. TaxID=1979401 RepID=UPI0029DE880B|nr:ferredoxin [Thalassovita sp.]